MISAADIFRGHSWRLGLVAGLIALPISLGLFWVWESFSSPPPGRRDGATFQVVEGRGEIINAGLRIPAGGDANRVIVATALPTAARAGAYASMSFDIEGLDAAQGAGVYFTRRQDPTVGHPRALSLAAVRQGRLEMAEDPRWVGEIEVIGFIMQGPIRRDITVRSITLLPRAVGFWDVVARLGRSWMALADWDAGSANFYIGASINERLLTPTAFVGLWVMCTWLLYLLFCRYAPAVGLRVNGSTALSVLLVLLVAGWSALDLRWQIDLFSRLRSVDSSSQMERDASRRWEEVRKRVFQQDVRVFIVSTERDSFEVLRTRYNLAGINSSVGLYRLPNANERRAGDFVLLLGDRQAARFDIASGELRFGAGTVKVQVVFDDPLLGMLVRVIA